VNSGTCFQRLVENPRPLSGIETAVSALVLGTLSVFTRRAGRRGFAHRGEGAAAGNNAFARVVFFLPDARRCSYACRVLAILIFETRRRQARVQMGGGNVPRPSASRPSSSRARIWTASASTREDKTTAALVCWLCVLGNPFYVRWYRAKFWLRAIATAHVHELSRGTKAGVAVVAFIFGAVRRFHHRPVPVAQKFGMGTILLLAASSWVVLGSFLVFLSARWQFPVIASLVVLAIIFSLWNDNHRIRTVPARPVQRDSVIAAFEKWHALVQKFPAPHPLYIVATEGGGIRAAYWTGIVLGGLQDANPNFATHVFAISGVSGGSLGAVVFDALVAENDGRSYEENAHEILSRDFLSPALASMLYPDLVQRFLPVPIAYFDRAQALERGWEKAWRDRMGDDRFSRSFVDLWPDDSQKWVPALFLNGTSVEKGNRIMTSNLRVTDSFFDVEDAAVKLGPPDEGATKVACHIPLSTAAHMSARFTYVSPAGRFPDGTHIVDGGYFENSGATTALEILTRINEWCAFKHITDVDPKIIMISNNPRRPPIAPAKPGPEKAGPTLTEPETVHGDLLGEVMSPVKALLNARDARGTFAQKAIAHQQRRFKAADTAPPSKDQPESLSPDIFYFSLEDQDVPLPLGWMLSDAARKRCDASGTAMAVVKNKTVADEISRTLRRLRPEPRSLTL
jgi:hypothetical protein